MGHRITMVCDNCDANHMLDDSMDLPPYWISLKVFVANGDGVVPDSKMEEVFLHFCSEKCVSDYFLGPVFQNIIKTIDQDNTDDTPEEEEEDDE